MYASLGIDHDGMVVDYQGRPRRILEHGAPISELY
jgi:hypothetical protein